MSLKSRTPSNERTSFGPIALGDPSRDSRESHPLVLTVQLAASAHFCRISRQPAYRITLIPALSEVLGLASVFGCATEHTAEARCTRTTRRNKFGTDGSEHQPWPTATEHQKPAAQSPLQTHPPRPDAVHEQQIGGSGMR